MNVHGIPDVEGGRPGELWVQWTRRGEFYRQFHGPRTDTVPHLLLDPSTYDGDTWSREVRTLCGRRVGIDPSVRNDTLATSCATCLRIAALRGFLTG